MTRAELKEKIENGRDILFDVSNKRWVIFTWLDDGVGIVEQFSNNELDVYADAEALLDKHLIDGVPLGDLSESVVITDYS